MFLAASVLAAVFLVLNLLVLVLEVNELARPVRRRCFGVLRWPPARLNADGGLTCLYTCPGV